MGHRELSIFRRLGLVAAVASAGAAAGAALAASTTLTTEQAKPGKVVVTSTRHALYLFTGHSCSGSCARAWPPLIATGTLTVAKGSGLNAKLVGKVRRSDGKVQVTYNGHALYTDSADTKAGDIKGQNASVFGGHWYLVNPAGNAVKPKRTCPKGYVPSKTGCVPGSY